MIKKVWFVFLPFLCFLFPRGRALGQSLSLSEFLDKAKPLYYDLDREGMKSFQSEVTDFQLEKGLSDMEIKDQFAQQLMELLMGLSFTADYDFKTVKVSRAPIDPKYKKGFTDETKFRALNQLGEAVRNGMEMEFGFWSKVQVPVLLNSMGEKNPNRVTRIQKTSDGYKLFLRDKGGRAVLFFGPDFKLLKLTGSAKGDEPITITTRFEESPKGWRINSYDILQSGKNYSAKVLYREWAGFALPAVITVTLSQEGSLEPSLFDKITFEEYSVVDKSGAVTSESMYPFNSVEERKAKLVIAAMIGGMQEFKKKVLDRFEFQLGAGPALMTGGQNLDQGEGLGFSINGAFGFQFTDSFALDLYVDVGGYSSPNAALVGGLNVSRTGAGLLGKYRFSPPGHLRPYLFGGFSVMNDRYNLRSADNTGSLNESFFNDGLLAGLGIELPLSDFRYLFLQGGVNWDFSSRNYPNGGYGPSAGTFVPVQFGMVFGR